MNNILRAIVLHDYEFVMVVDLSSGRYVKYIGNDAYAHIPGQGDHAAQVRAVAEGFVLPEDREEYLAKMSSVRPICGISIWPILCPIPAEITDSAPPTGPLSTRTAATIASSPQP